MASSLGKALKLTRGPIGKAALATVILRMINVLAGFVITLALARFLGVAQFGSYSYAISAAMLIAIVSRGGFNLLLVKNIPAYAAKADWASLADLMRASFRNALVAALILGTAFIAFETLREGDVRRLPTVAAVLAASTGVFITITFLMQGVLRGFQKPWAYTPQFLIVQLSMSICVAIFLLLGKPSVTLIVSFFLLSWALAASVAWLCASRTLISRMGNTHAVSNAPTQRWNRVALLMLACHSLMMLAGHIEVFVLGSTVSADSAGTYAIALRFSQLTLIPAFSISTGLAPKIAELHSTGALADITDRLRTSAMFTAIGAGIFAVLCIVGFTLATEFIGADYNAAMWPLIIMATGYLVGALAGRPLDVMLMTGQEKTAAKISLSVAAAVIIACFLFVPATGEVVAAGITACAFALHQWVLSLAVYRVHAIRTDFISAVN